MSRSVICCTVRDDWTSQRSKTGKERYEQDAACSSSRRVRRGVLICIADPEVAFDGSASDLEVAFGIAGASGSTTRLYPSLHGRRADSSWGARPSGAGLVHLCVGAQGRAPGALDRVSSDHDVGTGSGVVADACGHLHTTGGLS